MKFLRGLFQDTRPLDQPEGTYRDARNIVLSEELGAIVNEKGVNLLTAFPISTTAIHEHLLLNDTIVFFLVTAGGGDEIGIYDPEEFEYTTIFTHPELKFGDYIDAESYVDYKGDFILLWVDGKNPPRYLNLSNPIQL